MKFSILNKKDYQALLYTWLIFYLYFSASADLKVFITGAKWASIYSGSLLAIYLVFWTLAIIKRKTDDRKEE